MTSNEDDSDSKPEPGGKPDPGSKPDPSPKLSPQNADVANEHVDLVLNALATPQFKWRTVAGVAKDTGLTTNLVMKVLAATADKIVKSSVPSNDGQDLYTTREHFREKASTGEKLLGAIKNRAV